MRRGWRGLLAALCAAGPAIAAPTPPEGPRAPVAVTYRILNQQSVVPAEFTVLFAPFARAARVTFAGEPGYLLVDMVSHSVIMVLDQPKMSIKIPTPAMLKPYFDWRDSVAFTPGPAGEVGGRPCQFWTARTAKGSGDICVTSDGVPLSVEAIGTKGDRTRIEAVAMKREAYDPGQFELPPDHPMLGAGGAGASLLSPFGGQ